MKKSRFAPFLYRKIIELFETIPNSDFLRFYKTLHQIISNDNEISEIICKDETVQENIGVTLAFISRNITRLAKIQRQELLYNIFDCNSMFFLPITN